MILSIDITYYAYERRVQQRAVVPYLREVSTFSGNVYSVTHYYVMCRGLFLGLPLVKVERRILLFLLRTLACSSGPGIALHG